MISTFRKKLSSTYIKVLLTVLVLMLMFWGAVGDTFRTVETPIVLTIGEIKYTKQTLDNAIARHISLLQRNNDNMHAASEGELRQVILRQIINAGLLQQEAKHLGIEIGDDAVRYEIINNMPNFTKDGKFDKNLLETFLQNAGLTESEFITRLREEIAQKILIKLMTSTNLTNELLVRQVVRSLYSKRKLEVFEVNKASLTISQNPSKEELQEILKANKEKFTVPEVRHVSYILLNSKMIRTTPIIEDSEISQFYTDHTYLFHIPEMRSMQKIILKTEAEAKETAKKIHDATTFAATAKLLKQNIEAHPLPLTLEGFAPEVAQTIHSLKEDQISKPVYTPLGWCIFRIVKIIPEKIQPLESVAPEIKKQLQEQKLYELYISTAQNIDQDINSGMTIDAIAHKYNLPLCSIKVNRNDTAISNKEQCTIPEAPIFIDSLFAAKENSISNVRISNTESFIFLVKAIEPKYVRQFTQISQELENIWKLQQKESIIRTTLEEHKANLERHYLPQKQHTDIKIKTAIKTIDLFDSIQWLEPDQLIDIFTMRVGEYSALFTDKNNNMQFIKVIAAEEPEESTIQEAIPQEITKLGHLQSIIISDYINYLKQRYTIYLKDTAL